MDGLIESALRLATPILIVSLGELISQRAGVINIGLEGMMAAGAFTGYVVMLSTGSPTLAAVAAILAGALVAVLMAVFSVWGKVNQILVGFAIFVLVPGLMAFLYDQALQSHGVTPLLPSFSILPPGSIPVVGPLLSGNMFYWIAIALIPLIAFLFGGTRFGLRLIASGHNPSIAVSKGVNVVFTRTVAVLICGGLAGLAGAAVTVGALGSYSSTATGGRGFIALAIVILGRWKLRGVILATFAISLVDAFRLRLASEIGLPVQVLAMAPWLAMLIMLILGARSSVSPAGINQNPQTHK